MVNSSETDLKKKASRKQNPKSPLIMSPETNKKNNNNAKLEITIVDFNTLNHLEERTNTYYKRDESKWNRNFFTYISDNHCVKSVHIWSFSGPYFPAFGLNTDRYLKHRNCRAQKMLCSFNVAQKFARLARHFLRASFSFSSLCDFK